MYCGLYSDPPCSRLSDRLTSSPSPLRYFREDLGIDDTKVMKDIHDVIIKTLLCIESHVIGQVGGHWGSEYNMSCVRACVRVCMYVCRC